MTMTRRREKNKKKQSLFRVSFPLSLSLSLSMTRGAQSAFKEGSPTCEKGKRKEKWRRDLRFEMEKQAVQKQKKKGGGALYKGVQTYMKP